MFVLSWRSFSTYIMHAHTQEVKQWERERVRRRRTKTNKPTMFTNIGAAFHFGWQKIPKNTNVSSNECTIFQYYNVRCATISKRHTFVNYVWERNNNVRMKILSSVEPAFNCENGMRKFLSFRERERENFPCEKVSSQYFAKWLEYGR